MTPSRPPILAAGVERRLAPRPLPVHLTAALLLWLSSRGAWRLLNGGSATSSAEEERLRLLAAEIAALGPEAFREAVDAELCRRAGGFIDGLDRYRRHELRRPPEDAPVLWRQGTTRLLDYGTAGQTAPILVVPSLINRFYVLDLLPGHSFLRHVAARGLRPFVVDWGEPGAAERDFSIADYVARLGGALRVAAEAAGAPVAVLGYCMGGLLALALALLHPGTTACLALLATPWDFHAERAAQAAMLGRLAEFFPACADDTGCLPVEIIQALFQTLDPFLAERKFIRFAGLDPASGEARRFVALEDWINDGVPLPLSVATECMRGWYGDNLPGRGLWRVGETAVDPRALRCPALAVVPSRDRIVPPASAEGLAAALPDVEVMRLPFGHIGMMTATAAPDAVWTPIADWLRARLDRP